MVQRSVVVQRKDCRRRSTSVGHVVLDPPGGAQVRYSLDVTSTGLEPHGCGMRTMGAHMIGMRRTYAARFSLGPGISAAACTRSRLGRRRVLRAAGSALSRRFRARCRQRLLTTEGSMAHGLEEVLVGDHALGHPSSGIRHLLGLSLHGLWHSGSRGVPLNVG